MAEAEERAGWKLEKGSEKKPEKRPEKRPEKKPEKEPEAKAQQRADELLGREAQAELPEAEAKEKRRPGIRRRGARREASGTGGGGNPLGVRIARWLMGAILLGALCAACIFACYLMAYDYGVYSGENRAWEELEKRILRKYSIYALSGYKNGFHGEELSQTNFRFAVIQRGDMEQINLRKAGSYLYFQTDSDFLAAEKGAWNSPEGAYVYSCVLNENTQISYNLSLFGVFFLHDEVDSDAFNPAAAERGEVYHLLSYMETPPDMETGDLFAQGMRAAQWMNRLRYVIPAAGGLAGLAALYNLARLLILLFRALGRLLRRAGRVLGAGIRRATRGIRGVFGRLRDAVRGNIGLLGRWILGLIALSAAELLLGLIAGGQGYYNRENWIFLFWILEKIIVYPFLLAAALQVRRLRTESGHLAEGDLSGRVETSRMYYDFRKIGENLNEIGRGLDAAVSDRMKSERFKTELITNVSHDIKTPLTSIISYVDLLKKAPAGSPEAEEYLDTLERQSGKLKKLIEDLIEASKASTGNLSAELTRCAAGVALAQVVGEYEERLAERGIDLRVRMPEEPVHILADAQHLQRVFDNLMTNIERYAQSGTRAYVNLERIPGANGEGGRARIVFRNTSAEELNMTSEELLQRFSRGDSSRAGEGHGLGLSIAQSLTELMGGTMELAVDGDLFKVVAEFPEAE